MSRHAILVEASEYPIVLERSRTGFGAYAPDLPGCVAVGSTEAETLRLMAGAVEVHLAAMRRDGDPIPRPRQSRRAIAV